jgi:hypothetical protein
MEPGRGGQIYAGHGAPSSCRAVVQLDTNSIRHKALREYHRIQKKLEVLNQQIKRYHERDIPGFRSWLHATFGQQLTQQRELQQTIHEKRAFLIEIEELSDRYGLSQVAAYRKALWRREHPREAEEEDRLLDESRRKAAQSKADGADEEDPFGGMKNWDDNPFNDPDLDIPDELRDMMNRIVEEATGMRLPGGAWSRRSAARREDKSAKELYRAIVRRLHPDHHGQMTGAQKALWHEAQEAYKRRDSGALQGILARCDNSESGIGKHTAVSYILKLTHQLKDAVKQVNREMRIVKRDPAWNYEAQAANARYAQRIGFEMTQTILTLKLELEGLLGYLRRLEGMANRPQPSRQARKRRRPSPDDDFDLPF